MSRANPDLYNLTQEAMCITPQVATADVTGTTVDLQGYRGALFIVSLGDSGDTLSGSVYAELKLQHSDDDSTWAAVTAATDVVGTTPASGGVFATIDADGEEETNYLIQYRGGKRYARVVYDITGTHTNGTPVGCVALKVGSNYLPD